MSRHGWHPLNAVGHVFPHILTSLKLGQICQPQWNPARLSETGYFVPPGLLRRLNPELVQ